MKKVNTKNLVWLFLPLAAWGVLSVIFCVPSSRERTAFSEPGTVPLIPEDKVRLSNDPEKTEVFRNAGLGLFIHWGPNSQMGTEISWPLYNASEDYIEKYYALARTFNPTRFAPADWARLAKPVSYTHLTLPTNREV